MLKLITVDDVEEVFKSVGKRMSMEQRKLVANLVQAPWVQQSAFTLEKIFGGRV